jgi:hypothetical protein
MIAFSTSLITKGRETDMGQWIYPSKSEKHTCIFESERKGTVYTGEVVCTTCGVYLSSLVPVSPREINIKALRPA